MWFQNQVKKTLGGTVAPEVLYRWTLWQSDMDLTWQLDLQELQIICQLKTTGWWFLATPLEKI